MKHIMDVDAGEYFNNFDEYQEMEGMGLNVDPVDSSFAYVPKNKEANDNLQRMQANIHKRFKLGGDD